LWRYMRRSIVVKLFIIVAAMAAIGRAVVLGVTQSKEVRGSSETALQEPVARVDGVAETEHEPVPEDSAGLSADIRAEAYLRELRTSDLTTYTHPSGAFSFRYPKDFELLTSSPDADEQVVNVLHPDLALEIWIAVYPQGKYVLDLPEAYETSVWPAPGRGG
jgi:hypothetical protein